jgi:hypothetical protein
MTPSGAIARRCAVPALLGPAPRGYWVWVSSSETRDPAVQAAESREPREAPGHGERPQGMVPGRERRRTKAERGLMRLIATGGIIGLDVLLGAVLVGQDVAGWIVGLVIGLTSVALAGLLWSSRQL